MDHIHELDGEEDEDSWVSQMYTYWAGALWLIMYTDNDKPYEVRRCPSLFLLLVCIPSTLLKTGVDICLQMENVFELRDSAWWTVPPAVSIPMRRSHCS